MFLLTMCFEKTIFSKSDILRRCFSRAITFSCLSRERAFFSKRRLSGKTRTISSRKKSPHVVRKLSTFSKLRLDFTPVRLDLYADESISRKKSFYPKVRASSSKANKRNPNRLTGTDYFLDIQNKIATAKFN